MGTVRNFLGDVMLGVLFIAGLAPLAVNVIASVVAKRDVHPFPMYVVLVGVGLSLVIANVANDKVSASAVKLSSAVKDFIPIGRTGSGK